MSTTTTREIPGEPVRITLSVSLEIEGLNNDRLTTALAECVGDLLG